MLGGQYPFITFFTLTSLVVNFCYMGTPIILSLYHDPHETSMTCFIATNFAPKTALSTVACLFVYQMMQAILMKKQNPMWDLHLTISFA